MKWEFNDGGRSAAGYQAKDVGDCVTRAIAIAAEIPYKSVYDLICSNGSYARNGVRKETTRRVLGLLGWKWTATMKIGSGCTVHVREGEIPGGRVILQLSGHVCAVVDGVINDTFDPSRNGTRCVYGYWRKGGAS